MSDNNISPLIYVADNLINKPRHNYTLKSPWEKLLVLFLHFCFMGFEEHQLIQCLAPFLWLSLLESDVPTQNDNHCNVPQGSFTYDPVICRLSETSSTESNKTKCTVQEAAQQHLCPSDLYGFRQENNKRIYIHPHPQGITYRVTLTKLRQNLRKKREVRYKNRRQETFQKCQIKYRRIVVVCM